MAISIPPVHLRTVVDSPGGREGGRERERERREREEGEKEEKTLDNPVQRIE